MISATATELGIDSFCLLEPTCQQEKRKHVVEKYIPRAFDASAPTNVIHNGAGNSFPPDSMEENKQTWNLKKPKQKTQGQVNSEENLCG